jgi:hypothetical protein
MSVRVFVPLVSAGGEAEHLFEAIASDAPPEAHPAKLLPQISELFDFGLYRIGQTVREAVARFVDVRRRRVWLGASNARLAPWHLRISELQLGRLSDENARSAGLGLALAAICQAFGRDPGILFATGEVILTSEPGSRSVAIGAVEGVRAKLTLLGDYVVRHRSTLAGAVITALLPTCHPDGRSIAEAEADVLRRIEAEALSAGASLKVVFLSTLDEIEGPLGPFAVRAALTPLRVAAAAGIAALALALGGSWVALARAPVSLHWMPVLDEESGGPRRASYDVATDKLLVLRPCFDAQRQPLVRGGEALLLKVRADDAPSLASRLFPPRIMIAAVSRAADPLLLDADQLQAPGSPARGEEMVIAMPVERVDDEVRLFVLATRESALKSSDLLDELRARLKGLTGSAQLAAAATFLRDRLAGMLDFQFRVTTDETQCPT